MSGSQIFVALFAVLVIALSIWSVIVVIRSPDLKVKPLWVIGCLFGFVGFGIDWTTPDDLVILFGISVPVVTMFTALATGHVIVKTGFPFVSVVALFMARDAARPNGS